MKSRFKVDALTSERLYKKAWDDDWAIALLRNGMGRHFYPACIEAFLLDWDAVMDIRTRFKDDENNDHHFGAYWHAGCSL